MRMFHLIEKSRIVYCSLMQITENLASIIEEEKELILHKISKVKLQMFLNLARLILIQWKLFPEVVCCSRWIKRSLLKRRTFRLRNRIKQLFQICLMHHVLGVDFNKPNVKCSFQQLYHRIYLKLLCPKCRCTWITQLCSQIHKLTINRKTLLKKVCLVIVVRQNV